MQSSHSNEDFPELCIVGSSSILYQDEMKYLEFEQGLHLIPWMGNTSLLVDRYDARGFLDNQSKFGLKSNLKFRPSQEEIELEQRCDEERYLELNMELSEMEIGTEEEEKRNSRIFAQIPFNYETEKRTGINYENPSNEKRQTTVDKPLNEITDFTPYIPKPELQIPVTMTTPGTERMHNIIVKTARHVAEKGNQLEIVIKIKQQYNSSFDFLSFDHFLHPYYKHIKNLVLSGFKSLFETQFDDKNSTEGLYNCTTFNTYCYGAFLHPPLDNTNQLNQKYSNKVIT
ncbi:hypothetical protein LOD99_15383 [Oopsacas minuta]|uniref:SURP motif domain-containing protein n=1 Tax=Oopsacas minuta TaxID=111878 RepID=A0AAV7KCI7_9METZ|nr:hypothetical protein LOD99_15383 [Oopsacas minuta]